MLDIYISYLPSPSVQLWAFFGMVLIIIDLLAMTGVLFFLGVGALVTAVAIRFQLISSLYVQLMWWGASSLVIGIVFWRRFREIFGYKKKSRSSSPPDKRDS